MHLKYIKYYFQSNKWFLFVFILCLSAGLVGISLVEAFKAGVEKRVSANAKNFIASDLSISSRFNFSKNVEEKINNYVYDQQFITAKWVETYTLSSSKSSSRLSNINFVSKNFPFYGNLYEENKRPLLTIDWDLLHQKQVAYISNDIAQILNVSIGESLKIGETDFLIGKIFFTDDFTSFRGFNLAPKIFVSANFLEKTKLMQFGSTGTFSILIKANEASEDSIRKIKSDLLKLTNDSSIKIKGPKEASEQIARSLNYLSDFLGLITLLSYLLCLIGVYYFSHRFLSQSQKLTLLFKVLGLKTKEIFTSLSLYFLGLVFISTIISLSLIYLAKIPLENFLVLKTGEKLFIDISLKVVLKMLSFSVITTLLMLMPIIRAAVKIDAGLIFKSFPYELRKIPWQYFVPLNLVICLYSIYISSSFKVGLGFIGAIFLIIFFTALIFWVLYRSAEIDFIKRRFILKHAFLSLFRHYQSSYTVFLSLSLALTLVVFVLQLEKTIQNEFEFAKNEKHPDLFMFDLQDYQAQDFVKKAQEMGIILKSFSPMVRARLVSINEKEIQNASEENQDQFKTRESENEERFRNRGVNLSYRPNLSPSESIIKGKYFTDECPSHSQICEVSLEESYANRLSVKIGDMLTFEISGIKVKTKITSIRKIRWTSFEPNFFVLFQPGFIKDAPKTYISGIKLKNGEAISFVYKNISSQFSNVSLIEVKETILKMKKIFELISFSIISISAMALFVAFIVVIAIAINHLDLKQSEMRLMYLMGLKRKLRLSLFFTEPVFLYMFSFLASFIFGTYLTSFVSSFGFGVEVDFNLRRIFWVGSLLFTIILIIIFLKIQTLVNRSESKSLEM